MILQTFLSTDLDIGRRWNVHLRYQCPGTPSCVGTEIADTIRLGRAIIVSINASKVSVAILFEVNHAKALFLPRSGY